MILMKPEPHIPTFVGILILLVGMGATIFLVENSTKLFSQATSSNEPEAVTFTNVTDTAFVVSWTTQNPTRGSIKYQEHGLLRIPIPAFDVRDTPPQLTSRYTHFVKVENPLKPNTTYDIVIISGATEYQKTGFSVKTGDMLSPPAHRLDPAFGIVIDAHNQPVPDALVIASFEGSQMVSTVTNQDGSWTIPLGSLQNKQNSRYFIPGNSDQERLFFVGHDGQSTVVTTINNDAPVPPVKLGENYDFTKNARRRFNPVIGQSNLSISNATFNVLLPLDGASIPSGKPAFKGFGLPQKQVIITINGGLKPVAGKTTISPNGTWTWTPEVPLLSGKYTATVTSFTENNKPLTTSLSFSVFKSGTQVLGVATASASISPSPRTASPSPSPKVGSKPSPSLKPSPSKSASQSEQPVTGTTGPTTGLLFLGALFLLFGGVRILTKKATY